MKSFVKSNFPTDPNGFGNLVMQAALAEAQKKTNSMRCPEHKKHATLTVKGPGQISIRGCCEAFRKSVNEALAR
jgi:hypothetical protein